MAMFMVFGGIFSTSVKWWSSLLLLGAPSVRASNTLDHLLPHVFTLHPKCSAPAVQLFRRWADLKGAAALWGLARSQG